MTSLIELSDQFFDAFYELSTPLNRCVEYRAKDTRAAVRRSVELARKDDRRRANASAIGRAALRGEVREEVFEAATNNCWWKPEAKR